VKVTITIEDDVVTGDPVMRFEFDPPIHKDELQTGDFTPAAAIGLTLLESMTGKGGKITEINGE
jgi:hypothetical protein